jgi:hypothetical protein
MDQPTPTAAACNSHAPRSGKAALCARCGDEQARRQEDRVRRVEELSTVGMEMTRAVAREAVKYPAPQWCESYGVMSRAIRLSTALEARLDAGWPWHRPDAALQERRAAAQEDPSIEDELGNRSTIEIIEDICRGLNITPDLSVFQDDAPEGEPEGEPETVEPAVADAAAAAEAAPAEVPPLAPAAFATDGMPGDRVAAEVARRHQRYSQEI